MPNKIIVGGWSAVCDDIGRLKLHPSNKISFDTAEAGPGEMSGTIGDHPLSFDMTSNNRLKLVPPQMSSGEHRLEIMFNGTPFPGAPKLAIVQDLEVSQQFNSNNSLFSRLHFTIIIVVFLFFLATDTGYKSSVIKGTWIDVGQVR